VLVEYGYRHYAAISAAISATGALLFGGAGFANATVHSAPVPSSTTTTLADNTIATTINTATRQACGDFSVSLRSTDSVELNRPATQAGWRVDARNRLVAFEGVFDLLASVFQA
jgi:hypothetical protein